MAAVPLLAPEAILALAAACVLLFDGFVAGRSRGTALAGAGAAIAAGALALAAGRGAVRLGGTAFAVDGAAQFARTATCGILALLCLWLAGAPAGERASGRAVALLLIAGSGALAATGARDWLTLLIALEVATLPLVAVLGTEREGDEGGAPVLGHLVASGAATMAMAFGISLLLASSGSLALADTETGAAGWFAAVLVLGGLLVKLGAGPLDVPARRAFAGSPAWAVAAAASLPRIPVAVALARAVEVLGPQVPSLSLALYLAGAASILWGLVTAFFEADVRGVIARTGALNAGFVLLALGAGGAAGLRSAVFFAFAYALPSLGLMLVVSGEDPAVAGLAGMARRRRPAAWALVVFALSLVGVAPTVGFLGKLYVLGGVLRSGAAWAGILGIAASVASAVPFGRIVRRAFSDEMRPRAGHEEGGPASVVALAVILALTIVLGLATGPVLAVLGLPMP